MMATATAALGDGRDNRWSAWLAFWTGVIASVLANVLAAEPSVVARCISAWPAIAFLLVVEVITRGGRDHAHAGKEAPEPTRARRKPPSGGQVVQAETTGQNQSTAPPARTKSAIGRARRPITETRELAAKLRAQHPAISQAELARLLGISATRLRQVDQAEVHPEPPSSINDSNGNVRSEVAP